MKLPSIHLTKHAQDLCSENDEMLKQAIKDPKPRRGSRTRRLRRANLAVPPKLFCRLHAIPGQVPARVFADTDTGVLRGSGSAQAVEQLEQS